MFKRIIAWLWPVSIFLVGCGGNAAAVTENEVNVSNTAAASPANLAAVKQYTLDNAQQMKVGTGRLATAHDLVQDTQINQPNTNPYAFL